VALALPVVSLPATDYDTGKASATHNKRPSHPTATVLPDTIGQSHLLKPASFKSAPAIVTLLKTKPVGRSSIKWAVDPFIVIQSIQS
jgi:hypothetical protein